MPKISYEFVDSDNITEKQIEARFQLLVRLYPSFARFYTKNKFYSSVRPDSVMLVYHGDRLIGTGKFLWRDIADRGLKMAVYGFLVETDFRRRGIATQMMHKYIHEAREGGADILYGSTENPIAVGLQQGMGFRIIDADGTWIDAQTQVLSSATTSTWTAIAYDIRPGTIDRINAAGSLHLGIGPL